MWWFEWGISVAFVIFGLYMGCKYLRNIEGGKKIETASPGLRKKTYEELKKECIQLYDYETSGFLLEIAVNLYERKHSALDKLDDKAQKVIGLIGGGASLYALFGGFTSGFHVILTPLLVLSAICFFTSLVLLLIAIKPVETDIPEITRFNSTVILADPAFRAKIARRMIEVWQEITLGLTPILRRKGRYQTAAMILIVAGSSLLLANFLLLLRGTESASAESSLQCSYTLGQKQEGAFQCTETKK